MLYIRLGVAITTLSLASVQVAFAGDIGDRFKRWLLGSEAQAASVTDYRPELGRIAQGCLQCHDGVRARYIKVKHADAPLQFASSGKQVNHPVGMDYNYYATKKIGRYTPRYSLDPGIVLVDGMVTCVSCHGLKNAGASERILEARWDESPSARADTESCSASNKLTVGPSVTDLCLACHAM